MSLCLFLAPWCLWAAALLKTGSCILLHHPQNTLPARTRAFLVQGSGDAAIKCGPCACQSYKLFLSFQEMSQSKATKADDTFQQENTNCVEMLGLFDLTLDYQSCVLSIFNWPTEMHLWIDKNIALQFWMHFLWGWPLKNRCQPRNTVCLTCKTEGLSWPDELSKGAPVIFLYNLTVNSVHSFSH